MNDPICASPLGSESRSYNRSRLTTHLNASMEAHSLARIQKTFGDIFFGGVANSDSYGSPTRFFLPGLWPLSLHSSFEFFRHDSEEF